jgi:hypothetical protein
MRKIDNLYENISVESIRGAAIHAFKGHSHKREIKKFKKDFDKNCEMLFEDLVTCNWEKHISYRSLVKVNKNGKIRHVESPSLKTRIYQHLLLDILTPVYTKKDNRNGLLNCKKKCGLNSNFKNGSLLHKCEKEVGRENFLPLECVEIEDRCGYVFRDSTNLIDYINENEY